MNERPRIYVQSWPAGGFAVFMSGHSSPISRHDTEDEALMQAERYRRGLDAAADQWNTAPASGVSTDVGRDERS
jgi:hypothetical protein